jgi:thiol-disulfide isomerase/thioredoxin
MKTTRPVLATLLMTALPLTLIAATSLSGRGSRAEPRPAPAPTPTAPAVTPVTQGPRPLPPAENGVGRLVPNLAYKDLAGKKQTLGGSRAARATVVAFTSSSCPVSKKFAPALARLEAQYRAKGVEFIFVDPIASDTPADLKAMAAAQKWQGPVVRDTSGTIARALEARVTTDAFVLDGARTVVYRGAVSDQYGLGYARDAARHNYLSDALDAVLAGDPPIIAATEAPGCALAVPTAKAAPAPVTYYSRIARLMQTHCVECHHSGGTAPFPLDTLESVRAHAGAIAQAVERRAMPPWSAAPPTAGHKTLWVNDRSLPKADRADLLTWLGGSKPVGNVADAPLRRSFDRGWKIARPQAVFQLPQPVAVKAEGVMPYVNIDVPTGFTEDKWVNGLEIQPTARGVVHHVLVFAVARDASGKVARGDEAEGLNGFLAGYVPGTSAFIYPDGFAKKIPAGTTLRFQIHYTPNGTAATDQTRLGMTFAAKPPEHEVRVAGIANVLLNIPAGSTRHPEKGVIPVPVEAKILAFMPHMHVRATACRYDVVSPGGTRQTLLDVPRYDFNWQHYYRYADPVTIAKGSTIEFTGWYDNSAANPANPDPNKNVRWGPQTTDEMLLGYVEYYLEGPSEEQIISSVLTSLGGISGIEALFRQVDKNGDGTVTREELPRRGLFERLDTNHDNAVTLDEIRALAATVSAPKAAPGK